MHLDLRLPIGAMFVTLGLLIGGYGMVTHASPLYAVHSLGINIDLWWGIIMIAFGAIMLALAARAKRGA
jgi:formate hydrogenlyase subunit 3/multisubunit Na+/H+ antiporter MnhD subunit